MKILIGASSRNEIPNEYINLTKEISKDISNLGFELIFGAASTGMMGESTKYFKDIHSYTVEKYIDDLKNINTTDYFIEKTTFDRTKNMYYESDIILFLPGGTGTIAELFSILEENRSTNEPKTLIIYNYNNYYDNIINFINKCISDGFNSKDINNYYIVVDNKEDLLKKIISATK